MVMLDAMQKGGRVRVLQAELNDQPGVCLKLAGPLADIHSAADVARSMAEAMQVKAVVDVIAAPAAGSRPAYHAEPDYNALIEQPSVHVPKERDMAKQSPFAVGLIETQGFTAVFDAIDTAVKTAEVEVLAREKLGGGYITVIIKGDVAAVTAAVAAAKSRAEGLGRLIAAHVIASPTEAVLSLLPKL